MRRAPVLTASAVALLALTACGSEPAPATDAAAGDKPSAESTQQADPKAEATDALTTAVKEYTAALFSGDSAGFERVSARCADQMSQAKWSAMAKEAHHTYGAQEATGVKVEQLAGNLARVSYGAGNIPQFDRKSQSWTREDGSWKWDACPSSETTN